MRHLISWLSSHSYPAITLCVYRVTAVSSCRFRSLRKRCCCRQPQAPASGWMRLSHNRSAPCCFHRRELYRRPRPQRYRFVKNRTAGVTVLHICGKLVDLAHRVRLTGLYVNGLGIAHTLHGRRERLERSALGVTMKVTVSPGFAFLPIGSGSRFMPGTRIKARSWAVSI